MNQGTDLWAGRLLCGMTRPELAAALEAHLDTVFRVEHGETHGPGYPLVLAFLESLGVTFEAPGFITMPDGRMAPTIKAVGVLNGDRIRKARYRLAWPISRLADEAGVTVPLIRRLELRTRINATPDASLYKAVGALQLAGSVFAPSRHGHKRGDYCLVARPRR